MLLAVLLVISVASANAQSASPSAIDLNAILVRMEQAQARVRADQPAYTVTRAYKFFASDPKKTSSEVIARVDYQPPSTQNFSIEKATGSSQGEKIVKKVLEHEKEAAREPDCSGAVNRANYNFQYLRTDTLNGRRAYVLQITPKEKNKNTLMGQIWVDAGNYLLRRVEGDLSKSPSWWIKDVHLVLTYGQMAGVWVETAVTAVADVRLLGAHTMIAQAMNLEPAITVANMATSARPARAPVRNVSLGVLQP